MTKRSSYSPDKLTLELLHEPTEVEERIQEQIDKGDELRNREVVTSESFEILKEDSERWVNYTKQLLTKLFSNDSRAKDFTYYPSAVAVRRHKLSFHEELQISKDNVRKRINKLRSFKEQVPLLSRASSVLDNVLLETKSARMDMNKVFIVHGHDEEAKINVARFIEKLDLEAIILHEQSNDGDTIIEKMERYSNVGYGVVLYTECDVGAAKSDAESLENRARQNVVFEHGYLIGKLGRKNVSALVKGNIEIPNDISGVVYLLMNNDSWQLSLAKELKKANYEIDLNKLM